jgi:hypothetical protein
MLTMFSSAQGFAGAQGRMRTLTAGLFALLRRNWIFSTLLGLGTAIRLVTMLGYPPVLWFTGDSYFYLIYAHHFVPSPSKTLGYPLLLKALEPLHSLVLVALVQHAFGLATAVLAYVVLRRLRVPRWGAASATVPVLFDAYEIELEHLVMAEALFTLLLMAAVTIALWREGRRSVWAMAACGLLLSWAVLARSAGVAAVPVLLGGLILRRAGWRAVTATAVAFAVPIVAYMTWYHAVFGSYALTTSDGLYLWGRTTSFADCAKIKPPPDERVGCLSIPVSMRQPPGSIIWRDVPPRHMKHGPTAPANNKILEGFAIRAIEKQPVDYVVAVAESAGRAFYPGRFRYPNTSTEALYHFPRHPVPFATVFLHRYIPEKVAESYGHQKPNRVVEPWAGFMRTYQKYISLPGPALLLVFLLGLAGLFRRGRWAGARGVLLIVWSTAVIAFLFPLATADFDYRYVLPVVPFACMAAALAWFTALSPRSRDAAMPSPAASQATDPGPDPDSPSAVGGEAEVHAAVALRGRWGVAMGVRHG